MNKEYSPKDKLTYENAVSYIRITYNYINIFDKEAIKIAKGKRLNEVKKVCTYKQFLEVLKTLGISKKQAYRYIECQK